MKERNRTLGNLVPIDDTDLEVADGNPDVRGWEVRTTDGQKIGEVDNLIVDTNAMKVRYLDCELEDGDRHVALPIERARLDRDDEKVIMPGTVAELRGLPAFADIAAGAGDGEMRIPLSEEELAIGKRTVQRGEVDIEKHVERQRVHEPVSVRREEVDIERRPVQGARAGGARIEEGEIRVPLREEEVVVDKRPVVKEELVVRKRPVVETEVVDETVRKERVDIDRHETDGERGTRRR